ncbi:MAG TPA: hypothetical protein VFY99_10970 [Solirubrobacterales bacterium]
MSDATLGLGAYLGGVAVLAAIVLPVVYAAVVARRILLPGWSGAPARLAEAIAAIALLLWTSELAGTVGLFERVPLIVLSLAVGAGAWAIRGRAPAADPAEGARPPEGALPGLLPYALAAVAVALVAAAWAVPLAASYAGGIDGVDSMWYHLPQSAVFVQTGSVTDLHFTDPYFLNWYYPAHSELLHAVPMLAFDRDWLSPLLNHGFLALGLLSAWCIGRPWGLGPATTIAAAIVFGAEMMIDFQPGEARNDAIGLAFFLAAVAFLAHRVPKGLPVLVFAGLAAGLAIGTKLTMLAPVAALVVAVAVLGGRGRRLRDGGVFVTAVIAGGGFWYLRNLFHSGNPLPWIDQLGPVSLPAPDVALELRPPFSVAHYAFDFDVWGDFFAPGLADSVGPLWPLVLALVAAAGVAALVLGGRGRARGPLLPALGGVALFTLLAYAFTPLTASGPEGNPEGFVWNLRYIAPALAVGLVLVPLLPPLRGRRASLAVAGGLFAVLAVQTWRLEVWDFGQETWAVGSAVLVLAGFAAARLLAGSGRSRMLAAAAAAVLAAVAVVAGYAEQDRYLERRYADVLDGLHLDRAIAWANPVSDARIATAGRGGVFFQYGFYGEDLSNEVQWLGEPGPRGAWLPIETCEAFREALDEGGYDYVVTTYDRRFPGADRTSREGEWIRRDPAAEAISKDGPVTVFELGGGLDPSGCGPAEDEAAERPTGVAESDG